VAAGGQDVLVFLEDKHVLVFLEDFVTQDVGKHWRGFVDQNQVLEFLDWFFIEDYFEFYYVTHFVAHAAFGVVTDAFETTRFVDHGLGDPKTLVVEPLLFGVITNLLSEIKFH
jgi:hypothetical protein